MAKARLEKASLDDEIAELKAKNDELSQQIDKLEADNDKFQCPLHCAARASYASLAVGVVPVWIGRIACAPKGHHAVRNISQCVDITRQRSSMRTSCKARAPWRRCAAMRTEQIRFLL